MIRCWKLRPGESFAIVAVREAPLTLPKGCAEQTEA